MEVIDLVVDVAATVGDNIIVTDIKPTFVYENGKKTEKIEAYRYTCVLLDKKFDKLFVKVKDTINVLEIFDNAEFKKVKFTNLTLNVYWSSSGYKVSATADSIKYI